MVTGRAARRAARRDRVRDLVGHDRAEAALDLLELMELAWHDCYGESSPPEAVIDDVLLLSEGDLAGLVRAAHLAVVDSRDIRLAADDLRARGGPKQ